jgi:hypothetical protein
MYTLKDNYQKNIDILQENLKRGMSFEQVKQVIDNFQLQFKKAGLYGKDEKQFIKAMQEITAKHFTGIDIVFID